MTKIMNKTIRFLAGRYLRNYLRSLKRTLGVFEKFGEMAFREVSYPPGRWGRALNMYGGVSPWSNSWFDMATHLTGGYEFNFITGQYENKYTGATLANSASINLTSFLASPKNTLYNKNSEWKIVNEITIDGYDLPVSAYGHETKEGIKNPYSLATIGTIALLADDATIFGIIDDAAIPFLYAAAVTYDLAKRVYITYTLTNLSGKKYVGRANGLPS